MNICSYGCDREAKFFFKNGRGCCESTPNKCGAKRFRDSQKKKGDFKGTPYWATDGYIPITPWNKGLNKNVDLRILEYSKKLEISLKGKTTGKAKTDEAERIRRGKISETMKLNPKAGGLRARSGRGKKGWYKGYWCDSSWELAWVIYHLEYNYTFERNWDGFEYVYNGKTHIYYPDYVSGSDYYEIKGRRNYEQLTEKTKQKINQFSGSIKVLYETDMKPYLEYVISKYGKNFTELYENGSDPNGEEAVLKTVGPKGFGGSNPPASADDR